MEAIDILKDASDEELLRRICDKDLAAFNQLYVRYFEKVRKKAVHILFNSSDAEEVVQDVFFRIYTKAHQFKGNSAVGSWIFRIAVNQSLMKLRKRKAVLEEDLYSHSELWFTNSEILTRQLISNPDPIKDMEVRRMLLETSEYLKRLNWGDVLVLRVVDCLGNYEIAVKLGLSVPAVKSRYFRAKQLLAKKLGRLGDGVTYIKNPKTPQKNGVLGASRRALEPVR